MVRSALGSRPSGQEQRTTDSRSGVAMAAEEPTGYKPRCVNLYCKSMIVYGESFEMDPEYQDGQTDFWCLRTSKGLGPDGSGVSLCDCTNPERGCFQEY